MHRPQFGTQVFRRRGAIWLCLVLALTCVSVLAADTLLLKDGSRIEGRIVAQEPLHIVVQTASGRRRIPKSRLSRIDYKPWTDPRDQDKEASAKRAAQAEREQLALKQKQQEQARTEKAEAERTAREREERERIAAEKTEAHSRAQEALQPDAAPGCFAWNGPCGSIWRAAVLPGWGHVSAGRETAGYGIGTGFVALVAAALYESRAAARERGAYESTASRNLLLPFGVLTDARPLVFGYVLVENAARERSFQARADRSTFFLNLAFALYAVQLGDVVIAAALENENATRLRPDPNPRITVVWRHEF